VFGQAPALMALGFAAYLRFMRGVETDNGKYYGRLQDQAYPINDDQAAWFYQLWQEQAPDSLVEAVLQNQNLWGLDLTTLPGFAQAVKKNLTLIEQEGMMKALRDLEVKQISAS
jgi:tagaturonate reductase